MLTIGTVPVCPTGTHIRHARCPLTCVVPYCPRPLRHSVSIMADAAHMFSDVAGFGVSIFAAWAVTQRGNNSYSFGYHRTEIIGALISVFVIWGVTGALVWEAVNRILNPQPVDGKRKWGQELGLGLRVQGAGLPAHLPACVCL